MTQTYSESCPECVRLGHHNEIRYFYINFDESVLKCSSCLYPFKNFVYKSTKDERLYHYYRCDDDNNVIVQGAADESIAEEDQFPKNEFTEEIHPANLTDYFDDDWLNYQDPANADNSLMSDQIKTVNEADGIAGCVDDFDTSILDSLLNAHISSTSDDRQINKFIEEICRETVEPLQPPSDVDTYVELKPVVFCGQSVNVIPCPSPSPSSSSPQSTNVPKLSRCIQSIHKFDKSPKRNAKKYERKRTTTNQTKNKAPTTTSDSNKMKVECKAVPDQLDGAVSKRLQKLLNNQGKYRPLDLLNSLEQLNMKQASNATKVERSRNYQKDNKPKVDVKIETTIKTDV